LRVTSTPRHPRTAFSRRALLRGTAALAGAMPFQTWLTGQAKAQQRPARSEVSTPEGQRMLARYAQAIETMSNRPAWNPTSWIFQANIHDYPQVETGPNSVATIFDEAQGQNDEDRAAIRRARDLALGTPQLPGLWATCSHFGYAEHFLTWHRMHVYCMERIVEAASGGEPFAFPYWDYREVSGSGRTLPQFLESDPNGVKNWLYYTERTPAFKSGGTGLLERHVNLTLVKSERFLLGDAPEPGFTGRIEGGPHDQVHVAVGTEDGMGGTQLAARDPIFWLHHANIDRLWESWRRPDGQGNSSRDPTANTTWMARERFAFVDPTGTWISMTLTDAMQAAVVLNVRYDQFESFPPVEMAAMQDRNAPRAERAAAPRRAPMVVASSAANGRASITAKDVPVSIPITPAPAPAAAPGAPRTERSAPLASSYELLVDVETDRAPAGVYDVVVTVKKDAGGTEMVEVVAGSFTLFGAGHNTRAARSGGHAGHGQPGTAPAAAPAGAAIKRTWRSDVTALVRGGRLDPANPGAVTVRAIYESPKSPVNITGVRIEAR
jgi:tyrosinase